MCRRGTSPECARIPSRSDSTSWDTRAKLGEESIQHCSWLDQPRCATGAASVEIRRKLAAPVPQQCVRSRPVPLRGYTMLSKFMMCSASELLRRISAAEAVRDGASITETAQQVGVTRTTLYRWLKAFDPDKPRASLRPQTRGPKAPRWEGKVLDTVIELIRDYPHLWGRHRVTLALAGRGIIVSEATVSRMLPVARERITGRRLATGPRVPSSEAFGRRPSARVPTLTTGRHPKPFTEAVNPVAADFGRLHSLFGRQRFSRTAGSLRCRAPKCSVGV